MSYIDSVISEWLINFINYLEEQLVKHSSVTELQYDLVVKNLFLKVVQIKLNKK